MDDVRGALAALRPQFEPARRGEVRNSCLDPTRAKRELGWEATVELRDGLRRILGGL
jgi:UDP-glucose 4-epimerase